MDERLHKDGVIMATDHRGFNGGIHYYDVADGYGATLVFHGNKVFQNKDKYYLSVPEGGDSLAKNWEELQAQWVKLIDDFLDRHPEYVKKEQETPNVKCTSEKTGNIASGTVFARNTRIKYVHLQCDT